MKKLHISVVSLSVWQCIPPDSYLVRDIFHFVGLTPPSFPFQFRTAQVGLSMLKECNKCVWFCTKLWFVVSKCHIFWHDHIISPQSHCLVNVAPTTFNVWPVKVGFLIIYHHNLFIEVVFFLFCTQIYSPEVWNFPMLIISLVWQLTFGVRLGCSRLYIPDFGGAPLFERNVAKLQLSN